MVKIPEKVNVSVEGLKLKVSGPKGNLERTLSRLVNVTVASGNVDVTGDSKALVNTTFAHLGNMFKGVTLGFEKKLKIIYAHFPITIEVKGHDITIKNFLGEKQARKAILVGSTKLVIKGQEVMLSCIDIEELGGTYSNLKRATKIRFKDGRVFQDGLYPID
ncbi:MAG: 50S ribosomal protein L6 [Candidatus Micrarchaeota archaeon]|nr:50S ribosomal protein L6 [Candidatus Micrarchaeota archaeon]